MFGEIVPLFAILGVFFAPVLVVWIILEFRKSKLRNNEKMALIAQGIIPPEESRTKLKTNPNRFVSLRNGIVLIGIAIGILTGFSISEGMALEEEKAFWIYSSSILLFLGIGYLIYFFVTRNMTISNDNELPQE
ncbi:MAG: DUF6249 domain-containing protein [Bacteroidia bacterium]|nr:DUF6249 domain-containing protein [Bacteroidia bacterium]